jgi:diguanylate cyclase (GGDEF)-like protein
MESEARRTAQSFLLPGGIIVVLATVLRSTGILPVDEHSGLGFYLLTVAAAGTLLAWRFHSSRALYALLIVALADRLVWWLVNTRDLPDRVTNTGLDLVAILLPLNFVLLARWRERGVSLNTFFPKLVLITLQMAVVGVLCRPETVWSMHWMRVALLPRGLLGWTYLPQPVVLILTAALIAIGASWWIKKRPLDSAWFWALIACVLAVRSALAPGVATFYFATAAIVLVLALVDTSYLLAYHDELTGIPARRAFNEAAAQLQEPYVIAMVDVDYFKKFNDTYGHETGDQVLRMVAGKLSRVSGGGRSYRCGGEEFAVVFAGKTLQQALPHLEELRQTIEASQFAIRGPDRSQRRRPERRYHPSEKRGQTPRSVSVTASIGVAELSPWLPQLDDVMKAADLALYQAKDAGRNRVEMWSPVAASRLRPVTMKRTGAD